MADVTRDLIFIVLQFLYERKFLDAAHQLEQESGLYFNVKYLEELVLGGEWDAAEKYLSGFTKVDDNMESIKIFLEIRKQKYLEALDKGDRAKAADILLKELKVFSTYYEELYKDLTQLIILENIREHEQLSNYKDAKWGRNLIIAELKKMIDLNPLLQGKLQFPSFKNSRLRTLINQSLNWQHIFCKNPKPELEIKTLFIDHTCAQQSDAHASNPLMGSMSNPIPYPQMSAQMTFRPFQVNPPALSVSPASWLPNSPTVSHPEMSRVPVNLENTAAILTRSREAHGNLVELSRPIGGIPDEASHQINVGPVGFAGLSQPPNDVPRNVATTFSGLSFGLSGPVLPPNDLPRNVAVSLSVGSSVTSMDFHPRHPTHLLVGTNVGDISVWELASSERRVLNCFKIWNLAKHSADLQKALASNPSISVNKVIWSPDGNTLGVAYSKHLVHLFIYFVNDDLKPSFEIDAHVGGVNDMAFATSDNQLYIITCGDDKMVKVWDASTGDNRHTFEGHEAPVYSICPLPKQNPEGKNVIFSTDLDGSMITWFYDTHISKLSCQAPVHCCTTMVFSADRSRLFFCGTSKEGETHLVELNLREEFTTKIYSGFSKRSIGTVQFDTTKNRFLAVGDDYMVKFWEVDNINLLSTTDAGGGLPASPRIRFSREGKFLAVSANNNSIRILANSEGLQLLHENEDRRREITRVTSKTTKPPTVVSTPAAETAG